MAPAGSCGSESSNATPMTRDLMFAKLGMSDPEEKDDPKEQEVRLFLSRPSNEPDKPKPQAISELVQQLFAIIQEQDNKLRALEHATNMAYTHIQDLQARIQALQVQTRPIGGVVPGLAVPQDTIWGYPVTLTDSIDPGQIRYPTPITVGDLPDTTLGNLLSQINTSLAVPAEMMGRTVTAGTSSGSNSVTLTPSTSIGMRVVLENGVMTLADEGGGNYTLGIDNG